MMKNLFLVVCAMFLGSQLMAQNIIINNTITPANLVTNTLIGPGLVTSNITFTGDQQQIAFFEDNGSNIGLPEGVVMSTGRTNDIMPPNTPDFGFGGAGDPDVLATAQSVTSNPQAGNINSTHDAAVLEFDFIPNGDVVVFNFVFASEEYTTFINSQYNDAFGFYISGPNPAGGNYAVDNLALVPGTNEPITISTIYDDPGQTPPQMNGQYYLGNPQGHSFNGFTVPIEIRFDVFCDSTYHFKFAVADCQDGILDTGVFLEGGSFQAVPVDLTLETNIVGGGGQVDSVILEGCGTAADFLFTRPSCQSGDSLWVNVDIAGTAINGTDYGTIPDSVLFLPGETEVLVPFVAIQDGVFEGYEDVVLTVTNILPSGDTIVTTGTVWIFDNPNVEVIGHDTTIFCLQDSFPIYATGLNGVPPLTYEWDHSSSTADSAFATATENGTIDYYITVTDGCGFQDTDTLTVVVNQTLAIDTLIQFPASACLPDGAVSGVAEGLTTNLGQPLYNWTGPGPNSPDFIDASVWQNIPSGWYYFTVTDDVCTVSDSVFVEQLNAPQAAFTPSPQSGCAPLQVTFTNQSQNATTFEWNFGNGVVETVSGTGNQSAEYLSDAQVMLVAFDDNNCSDTAYVSIAVQPCGCTDPNATNYNPIATIDDGSCIFPIPVVQAPNIFTPNGDQVNDLFELDLEFTSDLELVVLNRWGNVMYEGNGPNPVWDGETSSGADAPEGTYFYKYVATGPGGDTVEGHGFVQLSRQ